MTLSSSNLKRSVAFWKDILEMKVFEEKEKAVVLGYDSNQTKLEIEDIGKGNIIKINTIK